MMRPRVSIRTVARRSRPRRDVVRSFLRVEPLEDRLVPSVTAALDGTTLVVRLGAAGDTAVVLGRGAVGAVSVNGQTFDQVSRIDVDGAGVAGQVVQLAGTLVVGGDVSVRRASEVQVDGSWEIGDFKVDLGNHPGGIHGGGAVVAHGDALLRAPGGDVSLTGPNDFHDKVSVLAQNVALNDVSLLRLARLRVVKDASLTSRSLQVIDPGRGDFTSLNRGSLTLQPASPDASINIGGYTGDYALPEDDFYAFGGFGRLTIGRADGRHAITVHDVVIPSEATIRTPLGGSISVVGVSLRAYGANLTLSAPRGRIRLDAGVNFSGKGLLRFDGPVVLGKEQVAVFASQGSVEFAGPVDDLDAPSILKIESGSGAGDVAFDGPVGDRAALGGLWIAEARNLHLKGSVSAGFVRQDVGVGTTTIDGPVTASPTADHPRAVDIVSTHLVLNGRIQAPGRAVHLRSRNGIVDRGGVIAGALAIQGSGTFQFLAPTNTVGILASKTIGLLEFYNSQDLTVGDVGEVHGIYSFGHAVSLRAAGNLSFGQGDSTSVIVGDSTLTLAAKNIVEHPRSVVTTRVLVVRQAENVDLSPLRNEFGSVSASVSGSFAVSDLSNLIVADRGGINGIVTNGGAVSIRTKGELIVDAPVNTQPGSGGTLRVLGKPQKVHVKVAPVLGAGDVTLTAD